MRPRVVLTLLLALLDVASASETRFVVDAEAGANTFSAVFDAAIGERITAISSALGCTLRVDEKKRTGQARCSVPLTSIKVDGDDVKSGHFWQWATNRKTEPDACAFTLDLPRLTLDEAAEPMKPVAFETEGTFTLCGRARSDHGPEKIRGTIIYLPSGSYKDVRTLRIRARIEGFDRDRYQIGPQWTDGWLARVQALAPVVATVGTIEVNAFATEAAKK